jgi:hypothetical protein
MSKDRRFNNFLVPKATPDFSDFAKAAEGAKIRDKLRRRDLSEYEKSLLEMDEREQALLYWGF